MNYRYYMSECSRIVVQTIISFGKSKHEFPHFYDIVNHTSKKSVPEKSAEEIIKEVTENAGLTAV